jgi:hypothetical protein
VTEPGNRAEAALFPALSPSTQPIRRSSRGEPWAPRRFHLCILRLQDVRRLFLQLCAAGSCLCSRTRHAPGGSFRVGKLMAAWPHGFPRSRDDRASSRTVHFPESFKQPTARPTRQREEATSRQTSANLVSQKDNSENFSSRRTPPTHPADGPTDPRAAVEFPVAPS